MWWLRFRRHYLNPMKTVRPRPRAILALALVTACAVVTLKLISITYGDAIDQIEKDVILNGRRGDPEETAFKIPGKMPRSIEYSMSKESNPSSGTEPNTSGLSKSKPNMERIQAIIQSIKEGQMSVSPRPNPLAPPRSNSMTPMMGDQPSNAHYQNVQMHPPHQQQNQPQNHQYSSRLPINTTSYPFLYNGRFVPERRIVHLDLKGAPPRVHYFEGFFRLISRLGATGLLIEWEDMFPYTGALADCRSGNAYTENEVRQILRWAKENRLEIIPLVQTFGHLEWVLKHHKFAHLREVDRYAQVICLTNPEALNLVKLIVDQVLSLHKQLENGTFFHMGADEAFQVGMCERCQAKIAENTTGTREKLMIDHITMVAEHVRTKYGRRVLMWHDMLNNVHPAVLNQTQLGRFVEPVVWVYAERVQDYFRPDQWSRFALGGFPNIWAASAFKGADGPDRFYSNPMHYMRNHFTWAEVMNQEYAKFRDFRGIILTGWQRFDHFAILCEILPVGVPSLAINLQIAKHGGQLSRAAVNETSQALGCAGLNPNSPGLAAVGCTFDGYEIYRQIQTLKQIDDEARATVDDNAVRGWISPFNVKHNYSSAWYLDQTLHKITSSLISYRNVARILRTEMGKIFFSDTVDEFLLEYVETKVERMMELEASVKKLGMFRVFQRRPFPIRSKRIGSETTSSSRVTTRPAAVRAQYGSRP